MPRPPSDVAYRQQARLAERLVQLVVEIAFVEARDP
jgi:hypothetical protein